MTVRTTWVRFFFRLDPSSFMRKSYTSLRNFFFLNLNRVPLTTKCLCLKSPFTRSHLHLSRECVWSRMAHVRTNTHRRCAYTLAFHPSDTNYSYYCQRLCSLAVSVDSRQDKMHRSLESLRSQFRTLILVSAEQWHVMLLTAFVLLFAFKQHDILLLTVLFLLQLNIFRFDTWI